MTSSAAALGVWASFALAGALGAQAQRGDSATRRPLRDSLLRDATTIDGRTLNAVPAFTLEQALQGKVAGMVVSMNDGAPWSDGQIQIRGAFTLLGDPSPLVIVDGVQTTNSFAALTTAFPQPGDASRRLSTANLSAFTPFEIERVEVLKGPEATSLFGARGAGGALVITTRRAAEGAAHWRAMLRTGGAEAMRLPASRCFASVGAAIATSPADSVGIRNAAAANGGTLPCRAQVADYFGAQALSSEAAAQWTGRVAGTGLLGSVARKDAPGAVAGSGMTRTNLRLNVDRAITDRLSAQLSTGLSLIDITRGGGSDGAATTLAEYPSWRDPRTQGPFGGTGTEISSPYVGLRDGRDDGTGTRTTGSLVLRYDAVRRQGTLLRLEAVTGLDRSAQDGNQATPAGDPFGTGADLFAVGTSRERSRLDNHALRARLETSLARRLPLTIESGVTLDRQSFNLVRRRTLGLSGSLDSVDVRSSITGMYATASTALLQQALEVGATVRSDRTGDWGGVRATYPSVQLRYHVPMPQSGVALDLHGAWGASGSTGALGTRPFQVFSGNALNAVAQGFERRSDLEGGIDLRSRDGRIALSYTAYRSNIGSLYANVIALTVTGPVAAVSPNVAAMRTTGHELTVAAQLVRRRSVSWDTRVTVSRSSSQLSAYSLPIRYELFTPSAGGGPSQLLTPGARLGDISIFGGMPIAQGTPAFDASGANTIRIGQFTLRTQLDWRSGGALYNASLLQSDLYRTSADYDAPSPIAGTPLGTYRRNAFATTDSTGVFLTTGSFVRLREVALRYAVPSRLSARVFGHAELAVSLTARNLALWSASTANDPEFSGIGTHPYSRVVADLRYPTMRQVFLGIDLGI